MVRTVDYTSRKRAVLAATINRYIKNAAPVSSEDISRDFGLSSATIRNIFSDLEKEGCLTHPYTSAGRIPTNKGFRLYVDFMIAQMELLSHEREQVLKEYNTEIKHLEEALEKTSEIISTITHYAGIVSFLEWHNKFFYRGISRILEQPEFRDVEKMRLLIKMMEDKKNFLEIINQDFEDKVKIYIGEELGCPEMQNCSLVVSNYRRKNRLSGKLAVLGPVRMEYNHIIPALEYVSQVLTGVLDELEY